MNINKFLVASSVSLSLLYSSTGMAVEVTFTEGNESLTITKPCKFEANFERTIRITVEEDHHTRKGSWEEAFGGVLLAGIPIVSSLLCFGLLGANLIQHVIGDPGPHFCYTPPCRY